MSKSNNLNIVDETPNDKWALIELLSLRFDDEPSNCKCNDTSCQILSYRVTTVQNKVYIRRFSNCFEGWSYLKQLLTFKEDVD